jgi:hypothetical protein
VLDAQVGDRVLPANAAARLSFVLLILDEFSKTQKCPATAVTLGVGALLPQAASKYPNRSPNGGKEGAILRVAMRMFSR